MYPLQRCSPQHGSQQFTLNWLLYPIPPETFIGQHWERNPLVVNRKDSGYFAALPGLEAVDEIITTTTTSHSAGSVDDIRIVKTHRDDVLVERRLQSLPNGLLDIQTIYREYQKGCSIVINHLHRRSAAIALLCGMLENDLHHPVGANLYLTPRSAQGFRPHLDTHDVFILQLHGFKDWRVSDPLKALPLPDMRCDVEALPHNFREYTLRPGDVLYLPRGFIHQAKTQSCSSLHLTVRIEVYRWIDLMIEALNELAEQQPELRRALRPGFFDLPLDVANASELAASLVQSMRDTALLERARVRLGSKLLGDGKIASASQFASLDAASDLTLDSTVKRSSGLFCKVLLSSEEAAILFAGNFVSGPKVLGPALNFIAGHKRFTPGDLPGELSPADKIDLVMRMINEGLLQVA